MKKLDLIEDRWLSIKEIAGHDLLLLWGACVWFCLFSKLHRKLLIYRLLQTAV